MYLPYHTLLMLSNAMSLNSPWWLPMPHLKMASIWLGLGEESDPVYIGLHAS